VGLTAFPDEDLDDGDVIVLPGDTPLLRPSTVSHLVQHHRDTDAACTLLTARVADPRGYGRVVRGKDDRVGRIVEEADATDDERAIDEVNTSIYCFRRALLAPALRRLSPENAQGEYYLTDVVEVLYDAGYPVVSVVADDPVETQGVNDRLQLSVAEAELRKRTNAGWLQRGVTMLDPGRTYIDATVELSTDVTLFPGTMLQGRCVVGPGAELGPDTRLVDCVVGAAATVEQTVGRDAEIGDRARVGPFAVLEPGAHIAPDARTGPFYTATSDDTGEPVSE
jgi:bifunctional UDP-N-acetylglucosamine pyrophosphorylase/glucosamine-1-phosphate N-acetyltransferase